MREQAIRHLLHAGFQGLRSTLAVLLCAFLVFCTGAGNAATADDYINDARVYLGKGGNDAAIIVLKNALLLEPDNAEARLLLGTTYLELGDAASAEKELSRVRELGLERAQWLVPLGRSYLLLGRHDALLNEVTNDASYPPGLRAEILQLQGEAYLGKRQFQLADRKFIDALQILPASSEALLGRARLAYLSQNRQKTAEYIDQVLANDPGSVAAWNMKGGLLSAAKLPQQAITAFQQSLKLDPDNIPARLGKTIAHIALGDLAAALSEIEKIRAKHPNLYLVNYLEALVQYLRQDIDKALVLLQLVLQAASGHLPSHLLIGSIYYQKGQFKQANRHLSTYSKATPRDIQATKLFAATLTKLGRSIMAIEALEQSQQFAPDDLQLLAMLGSLYLKTGDSEKGLELLRQAVDASPDSSAIRTRLAIGYILSGDPGQGVSELQGAVELGADLVPADILLVMMHLRQNEFDAALQAAQQLAEKQADKAVAQVLLGTACIGKRDYPAARRAFEHALEREPGFSEALFNLASLDQLEGDPEGAASRYQQILEQDAHNMNALLALARLAMRDGRQEQARQWLQQARDNHPDAIQPAVLLVELFQSQQQTTRALDVVRELQASHPDNPLIMRLLAITQGEAGQVTEAIATLGKLLEDQPGIPEAHYLLGRFYLTQQNMDAARDNLTRAIELQADYPAAQLLLARLELIQRNPASAKIIVAQLEQRHPEVAYREELEGDIHAAGNRYAEASQAYAAASARDGSQQLALKLFRSRYLGGNTQAAIETLRQWLNSHPDDVAVRMILATFLHQGGDHETAIDEYLAVIEKDPDNISALINLARLYQDQGSGKGLSYAERAYALSPDRVEVSDTLGWLLLHYGDARRGLLLLQDAAIRAPHMAEIRYHLAVALAKAGHHDEARNELARLLENHKDFPSSSYARELLNQVNKY